MATTKQKCSVCSDPTNYHCISCHVPVCNICSVFEENEEITNWKAGKSVAHCLKCKIKQGLITSETESQSETSVTSNSNRSNIVKKYQDNIKKLKHSIRPSSGSSEEESGGEGSEDSHADSDESMEALNLGKRKKKQSQKGKKKPGRKSKWTDEATDDLIDIILNDDNLKSKLIFQNTKNQQNGKMYERILKELKKRSADRSENITFCAAQLRTKFKKCVGECKKAALTIKTASGIKRFQDSKNYGFWFSQLFAVVKTRDSCQPEQAIEPSAMTTHGIGEKGKDGEKNEDGEKMEESEKNKGKLFVPVKGGNKKKKPDHGAEAVKLLKQLVENDTTTNVMNSMREEMGKSREHELKLFEMMCRTFKPHPQEPHQEHANQARTPNLTYLQSHQTHPRHSTAFINQGFQSNLHVLQPVIQPSTSQPFSASLSLSGEHPVFHNNPSKNTGY